jgi:hypothetical protein
LRRTGPRRSPATARCTTWSAIAWLAAPVRIRRGKLVKSPVGVANRIIDSLPTRRRATSWHPRAWPVAHAGTIHRGHPALSFATREARRVVRLSVRRDRPVRVPPWRECRVAQSDAAGSMKSSAYSGAGLRRLRSSHLLCAGGRHAPVRGGRGERPAKSWKRDSCPDARVARDPRLGGAPSGRVGCPSRPECRSPTRVVECLPWPANASWRSAPRGAGDFSISGSDARQRPSPLAVRTVVMPSPLPVARRGALARSRVLLC